MRKLFKTVAVTGLAAGALFGLAACDSGTAETTTKQENNGETTTQNQEKTGVYAPENGDTIAILKFGTHTSLDEIETGVKNTVEAGLGSTYTVKTYDCNFDSTIITQTISTIKNDNLAAIVAIATPVAVEVANEFEDIPVVFAAVSDPEGAGVTGDNVTGTSDAMQLSALVDLAYEVNPSIQKFGYIYTATEANSITNSRTLTELASSRNFNLTTKTINTSAEITETFNAVKDKGVEALIVSDDNSVASAMDTLSELCANAGVAMYCAADSEVKDGGMMGYSISYTALAEHTGKQVLEIVKDKKAVKDVPVKYFNQPSDLKLYYNSTFLNNCPSLKAMVPTTLLARGTDLAQ